MGNNLINIVFLFKENQVTIECVIPNHHHRSLTGPKHIKVQELCATYNVQIKFPERVMPPNPG